jgi:uncharacterized membrane protein YfcA
MSTIALLTLVCAITYTFEIVFGLAGTIMMVMVMAFFINTKTLVIYSILPQIMVGTIGLMRSPKTVELGYLARMVAFASVGGVIGLYVFYYVSADLFHTLLASAITVFGAYLVFWPGKLGLNNPLRYVLDTLAGASQALFGISGPIAMTRLLGTFNEKLVIRNYALAFFLSMNIFRGLGYLYNGTITADIGYMMAVSAPVLAVVLWYSNHLHLHVNERVFRTVVAWIILLGGVSMLLNSPNGG